MSLVDNKVIWFFCLIMFKLKLAKIKTDKYFMNLKTEFNEIHTNIY